ncbi:MAG: polymer-forming cytoskeletal protein [Candidatus Methylomirabilales bacterium]
MLGRNNSAQLFTVIGSDAKLEGTFDVADSIQIECDVGGRLKVGKRLVIGEKGSVRADVEAVDVVIYGQYEGKMVATGSVEITPTARVVGKIETDALVISKGAFFNGNVAKLNKSQADGGLRPLSVGELEELIRLHPSREGGGPTSSNGHISELVSRTPTEDFNGSNARETVE